jgi:hypothetical protein
VARLRKYLAHARLITWFYGFLDEVAVDPEFFVPNIPQKIGQGNKIVHGYQYMD